MSYKTYTGDYLDKVAFPMGGIGAGMICLEGRGAISHVSIRNTPNVFWEPCTFSAICIKGEKNIARVIESPVPRSRVFGTAGAGNGLAGYSYGLPRLRNAEFNSKFPFATINFQDELIPLDISLCGWSPFIPRDSDNSSLPVAGLEYTFTNNTDKFVEAVYSFNSRNFLFVHPRRAEVLDYQNGFIFTDPGDDNAPWERGEFCVATDDPDARVNRQWFRGGWWDCLTIAWKNIENGEMIENAQVMEGEASPGASIFVPVNLEPGESKTVRIMLSWYMPNTNITVGEVLEGQAVCECGCGCEGAESKKPTHKPWYAGRFASINEVADYWKANYDALRAKSAKFSECFFDTTLPGDLIDAVEANLTILKSPTVLRQPDGKLWCWEGCCDNSGCCSGSCTHVWNYAQAIPHLFPDLERSLRETEFIANQDERGHQMFRASLPIRETVHTHLAAADGQLGGIIKAYREWRISGDTQCLWPKIKDSINYCIETWDPSHEGTLSEPHHNTYDIEFWGPDVMCTSFYLGALKAAIEMGKALDDEDPLYSELLEKGMKYLDEKLYNGEYYIQNIQWIGLRAENPLVKMASDGGGYSPEAIKIMEKEGPKYQYGNGCISDGVIGFWMAEAAGLGKFGNLDRIKNHLKAIHKYNLKFDLSDHANPQRPGFALGDEGGLLLCTWPLGDKLSLPFVYSDEVWTGIEYQVAAHLMMHGLVDEGMEIVKTARERYDGKKRNPYNEYECGHWYARAMSSYSMIQGITGVRYDAVERTLYINPSVEGDFRSFLSTASGYANVGVKNGEPFIEVKDGDIPVEKIEYCA